LLAVAPAKATASKQGQEGGHLLLLHLVAAPESSPDHPHLLLAGILDMLASEPAPEAVKSGKQIRFKVAIYTLPPLRQVVHITKATLKTAFHILSILATLFFYQLSPSIGSAGTCPTPEWAAD
jgi:hypothetical protein